MKNTVFGAIAMLSVGVVAAADDWIALADLKYEAKFQRTVLTKENFIQFADACLPGHSGVAKDKFLAEWKMPLVNSVTTIGTPGKPGAMVISGTMGICIRDSENKFPIFPGEVYLRTAVPDGLQEAEMDKSFAALSAAIAKKGFAEIAYVNSNGSANVVLYTVQRENKGRLNYLDSFRPKDHFVPHADMILVNLPPNTNFTVSRTNERVWKLIY